MGWVAFLPLILNLVTFVEKLFDESGQGEVKKSTVVGAAKAVVDGFSSVSTGGQKETWESLAPFVDKAIDVAVGVANKAGWTDIKEDDVVEQMKYGL